MIKQTLVLCGLIVSLVSAAAADPMLNLTFPEKGGYVYWIEHKDAAGKLQITAPKRAAGAGTSIDLASAMVSGKLASGEIKVYNPKSGNLTAKSLANLAGKKDLKLKDADFDRVRTAQIVLKPADGKPNERIETAVVTLKDANSDEFTVLVDPSSEGVAEFHDIAGGQESVTVAYDGGRMTQDMEIPLDRESSVFSQEIVISAKVRTVKATTFQAQPTEEEDGKGEGKPSGKAKQQSSPAGWISVFAGLVFLGLMGFVGYVVMKSKGVTLEQSLKKLGAQFPETEEASIPAAVQEPQIDPNVCQFCGQRKDPATGACACSIGAAPGGQAGTPRLIGMQGPYSGRIFELAQGDTTIGRDASNGIALTDDSTSSRRHARVSRQDGGCVIADEGSSNGTLVNGSRIAGPQSLQPGDEVQIGSTRFKYES